MTFLLSHVFFSDSLKLNFIKVLSSKVIALQSLPLDEQFANEVGLERNISQNIKRN